MRNVCSESTYSDKIFKVIISNSRQLSSIQKRALFEVREKQNKKDLFQLLKLDTQSKIMTKLGISVQIFKNGVTVWRKALPIFPFIKPIESRTAQSHYKYNRTF